MLLSVVILTHNQKDLTLRCLKSIRDLFQKKDVEIILVDNGSDDNTIESVKSNFPETKVIRSENNLGVAAGRNLGLNKASGKYLMILDNDTIASPDSILKLLDFIESHPDCGLVAPRLCNPEGKTQKSFKDFPSMVVKFKNWFKGRGENDFVSDVPDVPIEPFYVIGAAQMFSSETYKAIGTLDEKIFFGPEDADFCIRIRETNKKVIYLPDIIITHDWQRSTTGKLFSKRTFRHIQGLWHFYWKYKRFF